MCKSITGWKKKKPKLRIEELHADGDEGDELVWSNIIFQIQTGLKDLWQIYKRMKELNILTLDDGKKNQQRKRLWIRLIPAVIIIYMGFPFNRQYLIDKSQVMISW